MLVKTIDQSTRDKNRRTYRLTFPMELAGDQLQNWLRSISGTLRIGPTRLGGVPTVAFEMTASPAGIVHRIKVPWQHADYVIGQLRSLVPGIRVEPEDDYGRRLWTRAVEIGLTHTSRQLRIGSPESLSASLLAAVQALDEGEAVVMQWVVTPAPPRHLPVHKEARSHHITAHTLTSGNLANRDEVEDRRSKLEEPNLMAVLRVGALAKTDVRATHLIYRVRASLASVRSPAVRFRRRLVSRQALQQRIDLAMAPAIFPMQLSVSELAPLIAWPIGAPFVSGLPQALSRHLPASSAIPVEGRILGRSNFPGNERLIAMSYEEACKHVHVAGPTGSGKSALLANMIKQDMEHGYGAILIENKGDLFQAAIDYVPQHRMQDVIIFDVTDTRYPIGFNILNQGEPRVAVDELNNLFDHLYRDAGGVWTREVLFFGLRTLIKHPNLTFLDLTTLLMPGTKEEIDWADRIRRTDDRELNHFWQRFENQNRAAQDRFVQPVLDRIWQLSSRPELRHIIGQSQSSFQMADVIAQRKILLVNLKNLPKETASLAGTLLMNAIWHAVKTTPAPGATFLYLDEFQDFINLPVDPEDMLAKSRSMNLGMVLAHQHLGQLPADLRQAIMANARTKVVFQTSAEDAQRMSREFGNAVAEHDFMHLGQYETISRIATSSGISPPLSMSTNQPSPSYHSASKVRTLSRERYGKAKSDVMDEIDGRVKQHRANDNRPRPKVGGLWN